MIGGRLRAPSGGNDLRCCGPHAPGSPLTTKEGVMSTRFAVFAAVVALAAAPSLVSSGPTLKPHMFGDNEVPPVTDQGTTGKFDIEFNQDITEGEYKLEVYSGVRVTQAHLHCGRAGANGPVIVFLAGFHDRGWDVDGKWVGNSTVTNANVVNTTCGATLKDIYNQALAGNVYVNAHSVAKPGGVARGQLVK